MRKLYIAHAKSRSDNNLVNQELSFDVFCEKLKNPLITNETIDEYVNMDSVSKANVKDCGGFIGGKVIDGSRRKEKIEFRSILTLDADLATDKLINDFSKLCSYKACMYSTHSHTKEQSRVRIILPLTRNISIEEYEIISQYITSAIGSEYFDECSYRPNQLMYWPSHPKDGEYVFKETSHDWLDPDDVLKIINSESPSLVDYCKYHHSRGNIEDPLLKDGVIGEFNRKYYPITKVFNELIPGIYLPTSNSNRYKYFESNNLPGVQIIDDKFVYSFHAKDPACGRLWSAFDLVRIHKLGVNATCKEMVKFAVNSCGINFKSVKRKSNSGEWAWTSELQYNSNGVIKGNITNCCLILEKDPNLQNFRYNTFSDDIEITGKLPWKNNKQFWTDADDAQLAYYIDKNYGKFSANIVETSFKKCADDRSYHPVVDYLHNLQGWDGVSRVDTLFIDYLGAEDNELSRKAARLTLMAAVRRVIWPGTKFDYITVLNGPQGIGKSTLISKLGMQWYSDSLSISDMNDKTAAEKVQGNWIMEISEMAGMKKAETEKVKAFISREIDKYRKAFGKKTSPHPRQCVFFGTTNSDTGFLRDTTGNRRYLNIKVFGDSRLKPWDIDKYTIDQIWAEAELFASSKENLFLDRDIEKLAVRAQKDAMELDERQGLIQEYLDIYVPSDWYERDLVDRIEYIENYKGLPEFHDGYFQRDKVCNHEIWCECFRKSKEDLKSFDSYQLAAIMARVEGWEKANSQKRFKLYGKQRYYMRNKFE